MLAMLAIAGYCQSTSGSFASLSSPSDRLSMVKNSIVVPLWHEKTFWPVYERYVLEGRELSATTYRALHGLAFANGWDDAVAASETSHNYLAQRADELSLKRKYYREIGDDFNGVLALQFLQTETVMDMMESFAIYEQSPWKNFRFQTDAIPDEKIREAKNNMLRAALGISGDDARRFLEIYERYEDECDVLLDGYEIYSLYAGEPSDYTPALARRLGDNLLVVSERELKLKEKYFNEVQTQLGAILATGFLAWEDYYSIIRKMHAWADVP